MTQAQVEAVRDVRASRSQRPPDVPGARSGVAARRLVTPNEITRVFRSACGCARDEVVELLPDYEPVGPLLRASRADDVASIERGVGRYLVCQASLMDDTAARTEIDARLRVGARIRVVDRLPQWVRMVDRRVAILASASVPSSHGALVIHERAVVKSLLTLFTATWHQADDASRESGPRCRPRDRDVLTTMGRGDTDEVAARSMDVSVRTYRRYVADLMDALGATSRFQAGVLAASRGWI